MHNYHDVNERLPAGQDPLGELPERIHRRDRRRLAPEHHGLHDDPGLSSSRPLSANAYNFMQPSSNDAWGGYGSALTVPTILALSAVVYTTVVGTLVTSYWCPSDQAPTIEIYRPTTTGPYSMQNARRSNYGCATGQYTEYNCLTPTTPTLSPDRAMFYTDASTGFRRCPGRPELLGHDRREEPRDHQLVRVVLVLWAVLGLGHSHLDASRGLAPDHGQCLEFDPECAWGNRDSTANCEKYKRGSYAWYVEPAPRCLNFVHG